MAVNKSISHLLKYQTCLWCLLILISKGSIAQPNSLKADSLLKKADALFYKNPDQGIAAGLFALNYSQKEKSVVHEVKSLNLLAGFFWQIKDYAKANEYAQKSVLVSKNAAIDSLTGDGLVILGVIKHSRQQYQQAIEQYQKAGVYYSRKNLSNRLAILYLNIGLCQSAIARYEMANFYYFKAADLFAALRDNNNLAEIFSYIGTCYAKLNEYPRAITYNKKSLQIRALLNDAPSMAQTYNNLGYAFKQSGRPDSAIFYLSRSLHIRESIKDSSLLVNTLQNMGSAWKMKGSLEKAERYISRSLNIAARYNMQAETAKGNLDMAELLFAEKKYAAALTTANKTQQTAAALKLPEVLMNVYALKAALFAQTGEAKQALLYTNKRDVIKDSIFTAAKNATIAELDVKYQTSQKEKDIAALNLTNGLQKKVVKQQNVLIIVLIIASVLMLVLFAVAYHNFRLKNKANQRIQTLMQDLHHRVKNNLQILSGLFSMQINELNDESTNNTLRENESRLTSMNLIHNKLYLDNTTTQIEMAEYLTNLLQHVKASFSGRTAQDINLRIEIDPIMMEADKAVAIGLIVNELATNAFKYAFTEIFDCEIYLGLKQHAKSKVLLTFSDNGGGIKRENQKSEPSFGLKLVGLMARQLNSTLVTRNDNGAFYQLQIGI